MAQAMASMAGLSGASQAVLEGGLMSSKARLPSRSPSASRPSVWAPRAQHHHHQQQQQTRDESSGASGRRSVLSLLAASVTVGAFAKQALAEARPLKIQVATPAPGGKPATAETEEALDTNLPLKQRFYIEALPPEQAAIRAKESAKDILNVKSLIDKKQWPYVQNDLRLKASYLRYDLNTVISAKPKDQKKPLKDLTKKLFDNLDNLDYAARQKSTPSAEKYYAETVSALNDVLAKLG